MLSYQLRMLGFKEFSLKFIYVGKGHPLFSWTSTYILYDSSNIMSVTKIEEKMKTNCDGEIAIIPRNISSRVEQHPIHIQYKMFPELTKDEIFLFSSQEKYKDFDGAHSAPQGRKSSKDSRIDFYFVQLFYHDITRIFFRVLTRVPIKVGFKNKERKDVS